MKAIREDTFKDVGDHRLKIAEEVYVSRLINRWLILIIIKIRLLVNKRVKYSEVLM